MKERKPWGRGRGAAAACLVAAALSLSGCVAGAVLFGGAAALVIKEGFIDEDTYEGVVQTTPGKAYRSVMDVMDRLCHKIVLDKALRRVTGTWKNVDLEVEVEDLGGGEVKIHVKARKYLMADKEAAMEVFHMILSNIKGC